MKRELIVCRFKSKEYKLLKRLAKEKNMSVRKYIKKLILENSN